MREEGDMMDLTVSRQTASGIVDVGSIRSIESPHPLFSYSPEYLADPRRGALSLSLPLQSDSFPENEFRPYFEGLLPEGDERRALAANLAVREDDYLAMLARCGVDCIGDVILDRRAYAAPAAYRQVELASLKSTAASSASRARIHTESRLSLAGTQSKIGLYHDGSAGISEGWFQPLGGAPSNYILKFADGELPDLLTIEYLSLACAKACGLEVAETHLLSPRAPVLCSQRFDRKEGAGGIVDGLPAPLRLHQEDFAQAMGLLPASKYAELQPSTAQSVAHFMQRRFSAPGLARLAFARIALFNYLIGNCDNHLKNLSISYSEDGRSFRLSPAYDIVSTAYFERFSRQMGMALGATRDIDEVGPRDILAFSRQAGIGPRLLSGVVERFESSAVPALRKAASALAEGGFDAAPYICDDLEGELAPRLRVLQAATGK